MTSTHIEESQVYDCRVKDDEDYVIQFYVTIIENCESRKKRSSSEESVSINPAIDVSTTIFTFFPRELLERLDTIEKSRSGDGQKVMEQGVCLKKKGLIMFFLFGVSSFYIFHGVVVYLVSHC